MSFNHQIQWRKVLTIIQYIIPLICSCRHIFFNKDITICLNSRKLWNVKAQVKEEWEVKISYSPKFFRCTHYHTQNLAPLAIECNVPAMNNWKNLSYAPFQNQEHVHMVEMWTHFTCSSFIIRHIVKNTTWGRKEFMCHKTILPADITRVRMVWLSLLWISIQRRD